ncbi:MAG: SM-20-related protein [Methylophagaceae bacterium]|jgi:SM-20-related protein
MGIDVDVIAETLSEQGYIILTEFIKPTLTQQLYQHVSTLPESAFNTAKVGRLQSVQQLDTVRNDKTRWLSNAHPIEQAYLNAMDTLKTQLNRKLFLGLRDYEAHFSHYPPGHFYQRHIDAFKGQSNRIISSVFYLNPEWSSLDQGHFILYQPNTGVKLQAVEPKMGTLVLFLSEQFPHEVLAAMRDRYSIAGWFRTDTVL